MLIDVPEGDTVRILSLDGGGVRGLLNAVFLAQLEGELRYPLQRCFDVIAGTSTGALLAAGLARPYGPREHHARASLFVDVFMDHARDIFPRRRTIPRYLTSAPFRPRPNAALDEVLHSYVRDTLLENAAVEVAIPAYDVAERRPVVFTRAGARRHTRNCLTLAEAARASAAAPTYLPAVRVDWEGRSRHLVDGGVFANDPALLTALGVWQTARNKRLRILSMGTGSGPFKVGYRYDDPSEASDPRNIRLFAGGGVETLMDANGQFAGDSIQRLVTPDDLLRIDYPFPNGVPGLDDSRSESLLAMKDVATDAWQREGARVKDWVSANQRPEP